MSKTICKYCANFDSCVFALKARYCVLGYTDRAQSDCSHYRSCLL